VKLSSPYQDVPTASYWTSGVRFLGLSANLSFAFAVGFAYNTELPALMGLTAKNSPEKSPISLQEIVQTDNLLGKLSILVTQARCFCHVGSVAEVKLPCLSDPTYQGVREMRTSPATTSTKSSPTAKKGLGVESLEGRLNLSTLFGLVNNYTVDVPTTGVYDVTIRNTGTRARQIAVDSTSSTSPIWIQSAAKFQGAAQGDTVVALSLSAGKHTLQVNALSGKVADVTKGTSAGSTSTASTALTTDPSFTSAYQTSETLLVGGSNNGGGSTKIRRNGGTTLASAPA
jgi:hypothetical protein